MTSVGALLSALVLGGAGAAAGAAAVPGTGAGSVGAASAVSAFEVRSPWSTGIGFRGATCSAASLASAVIPDVPGVYYGIDLVPTKRVPGTGNGGGLGRVTFTESPYGVSVSSRGTYVYDITIGLDRDRVKVPEGGVMTAWVTKSDLSEALRLGPLDEALEVSGKVEWNKFLVLVSLERSTEATDRWTGPIVVRGMSRSGMMHTLAGHGPFEKEPCSKYGF